MAKSKKQSKLNKSKKEDEATTTPDANTEKKDLPKRKASDEQLKLKREKNRLKKLRKRQIKRGLNENSEINNKRKDEALEYLKNWNTDDKANWKFVKIRQIWLLKNMFDTKMINDDDFEVLLKYVKGTKGNAKVNSMEKAQSIINELNEKWKDNDKGDSDVQLFNRAEKVVKL